MKTLFIMLVLILAVNLSANELQWVDEQIEAIKPPRSGMEVKALTKIKDPFIFLLDKKVKKKDTKAKRYTKASYKKSSKRVNNYMLNKRFRLSITINKTARINNKWYKLGDNLSGYKIAKIDASSVVLTKGKKNFLLSTHSKNTNLKFKN